MVKFMNGDEYFYMYVLLMIKIDRICKLNF